MKIVGILAICWTAFVWYCWTKGKIEERKNGNIQRHQGP